MKGLNSKTEQMDLGLTNGGLPLPVRGTFIHFAGVASEQPTLLGRTAPAKIDCAPGFVKRAVEAAAEACAQGEVKMQSTPSPAGLMTFSTWRQQMLGAPAPLHPSPVSEIVPSVVGFVGGSSTSSPFPQVVSFGGTPGSVLSTRPMPQNICGTAPGVDQRSVIASPDTRNKGSPEIVNSAPAMSKHPSIGSEKHELGACKRCCFFVRGRCQNGHACLFCHYEHDKRKRNKKSGR